MLTLLDKNFATLSMLLALIFVTATVGVLVWSGKASESGVITTALCSAVTGLAGGIGGYSMHKTADSSVQTPGVQITKTETGA
jgi:putative effector of murein hydrolase LrgA (UPF0299 family)